MGGQQAQQAMLTEILRGFHELEQDIGDPEVLAGYAEKTGLMSRAEVRNVCCSPGRFHTKVTARPWYSWTATT